jgi:hypothetical protein
MYQKHSCRIHDEFIRRSRKILGASNIINFVLSIILAVFERRKLFEQASAIFPSKMPLTQHLLYWRTRSSNRALAEKGQKSDSRALLISYTVAAAPLKTMG